MCITVELGTRGIDKNTIEAYVDICKLFSSNVLRTVPSITLSYKPGKHEIAEATNQLKNEIAVVMPYLEESGITLCIENYEGLPVLLLAETVSQIGSPFVRICLDTVNSIGRSEGYEEVMMHLAPLTASLNIKDFTISRLPYKMGYTLFATPAGEGELRVLDLVSRVPPETTAVIELWVPWQGTIEETVRTESVWAKKSLENLKSLLSSQ